MIGKNGVLNDNYLLEVKQSNKNIVFLETKYIT